MDLLRAVSENIARRTRSCQAIDIQSASLLRRIGKCDGAQIADAISCKATATAFQTLSDWFARNDGHIQGACFFGSVTTGSAWDWSSKSPKHSDGRYRHDQLFLGPSDIDGLVVGQLSEIEPLPSCSEVHILLDVYGNLVQSETVDLLGGIQLLSADQVLATLTKDLEVLPMYWRLCCCDSFLLGDMGELCEQIEDSAVKAFGSVQLLAEAAWEFNWRRIEALLEFQRRVVVEGAKRGLISGVGWKPPQSSNPPDPESYAILDAFAVGCGASS